MTRAARRSESRGGQVPAPGERSTSDIVTNVGECTREVVTGAPPIHDNYVANHSWCLAQAILRMTIERLRGRHGYYERPSQELRNAARNHKLARADRQPRESEWEGTLPYRDASGMS